MMEFAIVVHQVNVEDINPPHKRNFAIEVITCGEKVRAVAGGKNSKTRAICC
jgi:hypothetical protein